METAIKLLDGKMVASDEKLRSLVGRLRGNSRLTRQQKLIVLALYVADHPEHA